MNPFIAQIIMFGGNFAPRGWAFCNGQLLAISQNTALFSLLGTTYGGDGRKTFGLPNLTGRVPVSAGTSYYATYHLGQKDGSPTRTLTIAEMPNHGHSFSQPCSNVSPTGASDNPQSKVLAQSQEDIYGDPSPNVFMSPGVTTNAGGSQPFNIEQPFLVVNFIISLQGVYPTR